MKRILLILRMRLVLSFLFFIFSSPLFSQIMMGSHHLHQHDEKCGALHLEQKQAAELGIYGTPEYFESWMQGKIQEQAAGTSMRTLQEVRTIPVVVHIIHNGTPIGEGANIPLSQIQSQIRTLNEDFRRQNADAANTPTEFLPIAADAMLEFVLARQDPQGLPTTGINRIEGFKDIYDPSDASLISSLALWPPEEYLNVWVVPLNAPFIGYASFPVAPQLPGLNFQPSLRERDGVTIDYRYFGSGGNAVSSARGRTLTHEIGHFLGLRHIWGDAQNLNEGCDVDDFVTDTPNQQRPTSGCPTSLRASCGSRDMIENYMDYSADPCMNLFTQGQVERMNVVLASSERRASLINNRATLFPENIPALNLSLTSIIEPNDFFCENPTVPQIQVRNLGSTAINSVFLAVRVNSVNLYNQTIPLNLPLGESAILTLNPVTLNESSDNTFEVEILQLNGESAAQNASPTIISSTPSLQPKINLPYQYASGDINNLWRVVNPDQGITWTPINVNLDGSIQEAIYINNYENEEFGALDYFISPQFDLTGLTNAQLTFDIAHAPYNEEGFEDRLWVVVTTDCGSTVSLFNSIYQREGVEMQTAPPQREEYFPTSDNEFRKEVVNLSEYAGQANVRVALVGINGYGNNIFLKNIRISPTEEFNYNLRVNDLLSPGPIVDGTHQSEILELENTGNLPISTFLISRQLNNAQPVTFLGQGSLIPPGETVQVSLPRATLLERTNRLRFVVSRPNYDQNPDSPSDLNRFVIRNADSIPSPWRQYFNTSPLAPWQTINPENNQASFGVINLSSVNNEPQGALELRNMAPNNSYWLGSPLFDLSRTPTASILFDKAYSHEGGNPRLRILLSTNGGSSYEHVLSSQIGDEMASVPGTSGVNPNNRGDFERQFVDLTPFAGRGGDNVRVAFVIDQVTAATNPVFLDNIELFFTSTPEPVIPGQGSAKIYPNPASDVFNIAFNLESFEDVNIQFISMSGQIIHDVIYPSTLNQTYSFGTQLLSKGVFIVKIRSNSVNDTKRLIIK
ncbi:T9SS-dependent choice-of-anchor J family protein [Anditalea andensis]|uniref:Pregnancy-associated plasma protein-A n=1 Tax=Anditalea andensis TaxID=1048983 RepID=A0A074L4B1_9BACT|nr:choice-of-anchor J domain-containing protein [Anditalea andensis]KEO75325.1 Pregnancy-associated plasma protein-A [Anditalea andensis]